MSTKIESRGSAFNWSAKICFIITLSAIYFIIIAIVTLMNAVTWTTEDEILGIHHQKGLATIVKGFNVFFGVVCLITIIRLSYRIGDSILRIPDLRLRSHYNFVLLIFSFATIWLIPILYMIVVHYLYRYNAPSFIRHDITIQLFFTFLSINANVIFVQAIFLLLTSIMCTLRSYQTFRYLIKLRRHRLNPFKPYPDRYRTPPKSSQRLIYPSNTVTIPGRKPGCGVYGAPPGLFLQGKMNPARSKNQLLQQHSEAY